MQEVLTLAEIEERFPAEWILIGDPEIDESLEVVRGIVLCHSRDRDEVYRKAAGLKLRWFATHLTQPIPDDIAFAL